MVCKVLRNIGSKFSPSLEQSLEDLPHPMLLPASSGFVGNTPSEIGLLTALQTLITKSTPIT